MVKMNIKSWLLVGLVLVLISLLTSPAAAEITINDIVKKIDLFISPNSYDAYPGQSMIFELAFYNQGPYDRYYFADVLLVSGDLITTTENHRGCQGQGYLKSPGCRRRLRV
jgi:hypothetical protein